MVLSVTACRQSVSSIIMNHFFLLSAQDGGASLGKKLVKVGHRSKLRTLRKWNRTRGQHYPRSICALSTTINKALNMQSQIQAHPWWRTQLPFTAIGPKLWRKTFLKFHQTERAVPVFLSGPAFCPQP